MEEGPWGIGYIESTEEGPSFVIDRSVETSEVEAVQRARDVLARWLLHGPYEDLHMERESFQQAMAATAQSGPFGPDGRLQRALASWLSALRAFDDRTSHMVSAEYGRDSVEFQAWKDSLSVEFDRNFYYRFAYKLRNYTQHVHRPIQRVNVGQGLDGGGKLEVTLRVEFDPGTLLSTYSEWGAQVTADLRARRGQPIDVVSTVLNAHDSCSRAMAQLTLREAPRLIEACEAIERYGGEYSEPDRQAIFMYVERPREGSLEMRLFEIPVEDAARARQLLAGAPAQAAPPP